MKVQTIIPSNHCSIMIIGQSSGNAEEACGKPFAGTSGTLLRKILTNANIYHNNCILTNASSIKMKKFYLDTKMQVPTAAFQIELNRLKEEIETLNPNIIVALGAVPLAALTGLKGILAFRGTVLESTLVPGKKVIATYHPGSLNYDWTSFYKTILDFKKISYESTFSEIKYPEYNLQIAPSKGEILAYLEYLYKNQNELTIAIDLEHLTPGAHISWLGISHNPTQAMAIQFIKNRTSCFPELAEIEIWSAIAKLLGSNIKQVYHNASYDVMNLWYNMGIECKNIYFDTIIAAHVIWPEFPRDLGFLCSILLNIPPWKHTSGNQFEHGKYNALDAANTRALCDVMKDKINSDPCYKETFDMEMAEINPAGFMQLQGIKIDLEERDRLNIKYSEKMTEIEAGLNQILNKEINLNSPTQIKQLLYDDLALPVQYKRRKSATEPRKVTVDAEALEKLYILVKNPILKLLLEYRKYTKILQSINIQLSPENKVHTSYNITGTKFGRWSSSKSIILPYGSGNLQNIDRRIRSMYVPPPGYVLLQADYIGAEAHVVAHIIQDSVIMQAFDDGIDVHKLTAANMFQVDIKDVTSEQRKVGKTIRHGVNYSAGPVIVATQLGIEVKKAKEYLKQFHNATPQLHIYHKRVKEQLQINRTLITPLNRKHMFTGIWGDGLFRGAYAFIPQSTIGDLLNQSLIDYYEKTKDDPDVGIYKQLHDAIYIWCLEEEVNKRAVELYHSMHRPIHLPHIDLYIGIDFKIGKNWKDMEHLEVTGI